MLLASFQLSKQVSKVSSSASDKSIELIELSKTACRLDVGDLEVEARMREEVLVVIACSVR